MKKIFHYINNEVLVKAASLKTANLSVKILSGILVTKFIALFIGPEGMALIGNLRNFFGTLQSFAISGLYTGVVKLIGRCKENIALLTQTLSTVFYLGFFSSVFLAFVCYYNANLINDFIFINKDYKYVIKIMAIVLPFYALNMFAFAIMNGFSKYKILLIINIIGQILGLLVSLLLIWQDHIDGALVALVITPALNLLITIVGIAFRKNLMAHIKITEFTGSIIKNLSPNMITALVTAMALPIVYILIRNYIISKIGIKEAGYWTAMTRVSDYYLMFINALVALYILPRFSKIKSTKMIKTEVINFYKIVLPVFAVILGIVFLFKSFIIPVVFSEEFRPIEELFGYQILGDFVRVMAMVIAYNFLAKKMFTHFIIVEIFLVVIMYVASIYLIDVYGIHGAVMGHCVSYILYFGILLLTFYIPIFGVLNEDEQEDA